MNLSVTHSSYLFAFGLLMPLAAQAQVTAQSPAVAGPVTTVLASLGRGFYTNHGWPGTLATVGLSRPLSARSVLSFQPQLGFFRADSQEREPDKSPGEKYAVGLLDAALSVRTSRHPGRPALCFAVGPGLVAGSSTTLERYPGQYLNRDGTVTILIDPEYETVRLFKPTLYWGLGLDATIDRLYVQAGIESRTYQLLPGDLLSAHVRLGYRLR